MTPRVSVVGIPTLRPVLEAAGRAARRFPFAILAALVTTVAAIAFADADGSSKAWEAMLAVATLGLPLFVGLRIVGECRGLGARGQLVLGLLGAAPLVVVALAWNGWSEPIRFARYVQLSAAFHLFAAAAPALGGRSASFWLYNRLILERYLLGAIYAAVFFAGLALALAALHELFGVPVDDQAYLRLWILAAFCFHPWFFVAGVPADLAALGARADYPTALRAFTQYVLLPLVTLYLLLLTAYLAKVVVTRAWPSGWIGYLVSGVAATGILAQLLVHPVAGDPNNRWVTTFTRGFWIGLVPSIVMLWLAIGQRVSQYGITERRYFLIVLSLWLAGTAVHQLVTRSREIRAIPISLAAVALVTLAGPWGAYGVSERSQVGRLRGVLERVGVLVEGRVHPGDRPVARDDAREVGAVLRYLVQTHGTAAIDPWFGDSLAQIDTLARGTRPSGDNDRRARLIAERLGVRYSSARDEFAVRWRNLRAAPGPVALAGFDTLLVVTSADADSLGGGYRAMFDRRAGRLTVRHTSGPVVTFWLDSLARAAWDSAGARGSDWGLPPAWLRLDGEGAGRQLLLQLSTLQIQRSDDSLTIQSFNGTLLLGRR